MSMDPFPEVYGRADALDQRRTDVAGQQVEREQPVEGGGRFLGRGIAVPEQRRRRAGELDVPMAALMTLALAAVLEATGLLA